VRSFKWIVIFASLISGYGLAKYHVDGRVKSRQAQSDIRYLPSPQITKFMAIGFREALADFYWIDALNYFGEQLSKKVKTFKYLDAYIQNILNLDPLFTFFYDWGSTVYIYNGLEINRENMVKAIRLANQGIVTLDEVFQYDASLIQKAAFNYALDAAYYRASLDYFKLLGRLSSQTRSMLLIASSYARHLEDYEQEFSLREEFLAYQSFEAVTQSEIQEAYNLVLNASFTAKSLEFIKHLRVAMEKDEDLKELVEKRISQNSVFQQFSEIGSESESDKNRKFRFVKVRLDRNWMPSTLNLLLSIY